MDYAQAARYVQEIDLIGKLVVINDMGSRNVCTLEKDGKFKGVIGYEAYSDEQISTCEYRQPAGIGDTHWVVIAKDCGNKEVFHALEVGDREPKNPVFKFDVFDYELLLFEEGPWLNHIDEIYKKATEPEELVVDDFDV